MAKSICATMMTEDAAQELRERFAQMIGKSYDKFLHYDLSLYHGDNKDQYTWQWLLERVKARIDMHEACSAR